MKHKHGLTVLLTAALVAVSGMALADTEYLEHGRISFDTGGLLVKGAQDTEWAAAAVNALIVPGDTLWVDEEGTAELEMAGANFLRFADRSKAEIVAMPPDMFIRGWVGSFYVHRFARSEGTYIFAAPAATVDIARDGGKFLAFVLSPSYEGVDEGDRQAQAWGLLLDNLPDDEQAQVAFVFTNTPEERAEAEREAKASGG